MGMSANTIGNRYEVLEQLGAGGMGVVWLVRDRLRDRKVALKQVLMADDDQRLAITREFRTLSTLRHPNIVSVIEYGAHENQPYFTMEYLPGAVPLDQSPGQKVEQFIQMLQALGYLHRRAILHRDLKPGNVLVTPDGVVKVLDFGLARDTDKSRTGAGVAGTFNYMAPELFSEEPATTGSDLWAVGVMLCEQLTGHHPFDAGTISSLIASVLMRDPNLSGLDERMAPVVARLLSKNRGERYTDAWEVIEAICAAAQIETPPESREHRESFLQAAAFVGRDREYQCLVDALKSAVEGTGRLWLIAGESGVGKSRLLDEIRTRALVDGFVVLQGQAVEEGGLPFQLWRDPARKLVLGAPMSELSAGVLKELVPDIDSLLDRIVEAAPPLPPQAHRDRLMKTLLERFQAQSAPILLILEDLHWTAESLEVLKLMLPHIAAMRLLVIGSYRHDEKPHLSQELPGSSLLTMERLTLEAVAALSESMIGADAATPELVERLSRETEGNALFMVEVMRTLAEEAGSLRDIGHKTLPERILAGGMIALLRRRLSKVPEWTRDTLKLAAVIGRNIDERLMGVTELDVWLQTCALASILEPYNGVWRFTHDRLREVMLNDLAHEELIRLNQTAAQAIETVYPNDVRYAESLVQHWRTAGNAEREVHYIVQVAEYLIHISAEYERAESLLQRALALAGAQGRVLQQLGDVAEKRSRYNDAIGFYQSSLETNPPPEIQLTVFNRLSQVLGQQGKFAEGKSYAMRARELAEQSGDRRGLAESLSFMGIAAWFEGDYAAARVYHEASLELRRALQDRQGIASSLHDLGLVADDEGDYVTARRFVEESLQLRREIGDRWGTSLCLGTLGVVADDEGDYATARAYYQDSLQISFEIGDRQRAASMLGNIGIIADLEGDAIGARAYYEDSLQIYREIGYVKGIANTLTNLGILAYNEGDYASARACHEESLQLKREMGNRQGIAVSLINLGNAAYSEGDYGAARAYFEDSLAVRREIGDRRGIAMSLGNLGLLSYSEGDDAKARACYEDSLRIRHEIGDRQGIAHTGALLTIALVRLQDVDQARQTLRDTLQITRQMDVLPLMLLGLVAAAHWAHSRGQHRQAAVWISVAAEQGTLEMLYKSLLDPLQAAVRTRFSEADFEAIIEYSTDLDVRDVIDGLLGEI